MSVDLLINQIKKYLEQNGKLFICISGLSGAGKTYHAKILSQRLGLTHIDQDQFYNNPSLLPRFTFSNGARSKNWDCKEALDLKKMNETIDKHISTGIIFSGFACRDQWFDHDIDFQIHLSVTEDTCYIRRQEQGKDGYMGKMIVNELVYPFYIETIKNSHISFTIDANEKSDLTMNKIIEWLTKNLN